MAVGLKLKSEAEFEKLLKLVSEELFQAKVHYTISTEISRLAKSQLDEMNFAPVFWRYTYRAHAELALVRVLRIYDQHASGFHLLRLLRTIQTNQWLFTKEAFLARLQSRHNGDNLYEGVPNPRQLQADIEFVSHQSNPRIALLKKWRDEVVFHKQPQRLLSARPFEADYPLPFHEIGDLIEEGAKLVNRYYSYFSATTFGNDTRGSQWRDVAFVIEALKNHPDVLLFRADRKLIERSNRDGN